MRFEKHLKCTTVEAEKRFYPKRILLFATWGRIILCEAKGFFKISLNKKGGWFWNGKGAAVYIDFCKQHKLCGHFFSFFEEQNLRKEKVVMRLLGTQNRSIFVGGFLKIDSGRKQDILSNLGNANSIWLVNVKIGWTTPFCGKKGDLIFSTFSNLQNGVGTSKCRKHIN